MWGHAFGLGFGRDHNDALELHELQEALATFKDHRLNRRLDILATNTCTMSYIEAAYQLKREVEYLAASQVFVPLTGLPYKSILSSIRPEMDARKLGELIVNQYVRQFTNSPAGERVAMTLLDLDLAEGFDDLLERLARAITNAVGSGQDTNFQRLSEIQDVFFANPAGDVRPVLDLCVLARDLREPVGRFGSAGGGASTDSKETRSCGRIRAADADTSKNCGRGPTSCQQPSTATRSMVMSVSRGV